MRISGYLPSTCLNCSIETAVRCSRAFNNYILEYSCKTKLSILQNEDRHFPCPLSPDTPLLLLIKHLKFMTLSAFPVTTAIDPTHPSRDLRIVYQLVPFKHECLPTVVIIGNLVTN